jgi:site-specific DNA-cytosine methylase
MRRPHFKQWLSRELKYLSGEDTIALRRLAYLAQTSVPRLRERLILYAIATNRAERLKNFLYDSNYLEELETIRRVIGNNDAHALDKKTRTSLPARYQKAISSFNAAYRQIDTLKESKRLRWQRTVRLQKEKGISNADIYKQLGLDPGNVNAYLKNGDMDRVTLNTATTIMKYTMKTD